MSLISSIAAIATAGASAGETFWGSSVRISTSTTTGSLDRFFNNAAEFGEGGNIVQAISSNALSDSETEARSYVILRDPVDGSISSTRHAFQNEEGLEFLQQQVLFYHPDMDACFARARQWWDSTGNTSRVGGIQIDSDGTTVAKVLDNFRDRTAPGNGEFFIGVRNNEIECYPYDSTNHTSTIDGGDRRRTQPTSTGDDTHYAIWVNNGSSQVITGVRRDDGDFKMGFWKYGSVAVNSIPNPSAVRTISAEDSTLTNDYCDRAHSSSGNTCYGFRATGGKLNLFQIYNSSLTAYRKSQFTVQSSYNSQSVTVYINKCSMVYAGGYLYATFGVRFRVSGESNDSVMYPIFKFDPSNFQIVDALGIKATGGAEYVLDVAPMLGVNAAETCLYHCFVHSSESSRGGDSHKLLKLPLDFSTVPAQTLTGNFYHDSIELWDFNSSTTGGSLPVFSELFQSMAYTSGSTSSEGYRNEDQGSTNLIIENGNGTSATSVGSAILSSITTN
jgi:hypothetical protein